MFVVIKGHLQDHMTTHSVDRSFLCEICGAAFKTKSVQRKHVSSIHSNPRAFSCPLCVKRFNTSFALHRHSKSHDGQVRLHDGYARSHDDQVLSHEGLTSMNLNPSVATVTYDVILSVGGQNDVGGVQLAPLHHNAQTLVEYKSSRNGQLVTLTPTTGVEDVMKEESSTTKDEFNNELIEQGNEAGTEPTTYIYITSNM